MYISRIGKILRGLITFVINVKLKLLHPLQEKEMFLDSLFKSLKCFKDFLSLRSTLLNICHTFSKHYPERTAFDSIVQPGIAWKMH